MESVLIDIEDLYQFRNHVCWVALNFSAKFRILKSLVKILWAQIEQYELVRTVNSLKTACLKKLDI